MGTEKQRVEDELREARERLSRLEGEGGGPAAPAPPLWDPPLQATPSHPAATATFQSRSAHDLEELFGGRILAWIGGIAILFAAVLFVGMAFSRGWVNEEARAIGAAVFSLVLLFGGIWLHERHGRTEAARAAVAAGLGGLFATNVVATQFYELLAPGLGLAIAALVAAAGFAIAIRWDAPLVAGIGGIGALAAPPLLGIDPAGGAIAFTAIALAANVAVLVWRRWDWLALVAFVVSVPQLLAWIQRNSGIWGYGIEDDRVVLVLAVLLGFWLLYVIAAVGYELRVRDRDVAPVSSWFLLCAAAALVVFPGYAVLQTADVPSSLPVIWLFGFAGVHLVLGEAAIRFRLHREIGSLAIAIGLAISAFAFATALDGPALVIAWAAEAAALAALSTRVDASADPALSNSRRLLLAGAGFLGLAVIHTLAIEAPPKALVEGVASLGEAVAAIGACALAALAFGALTSRVEPRARFLGGLACGTALVYLGSVAIVDTVGVDSVGEVVQSGQVWLSAFWTVTGLATVVWGLARPNGSVRLAGLALLGAAIAKVWTFDLAELEQLPRVLSFVGLGLLLLAGSFAYQRLRPERTEADAAAR